MSGLATPSLAGIITAIASVLTAISLILVAAFPILKLSRDSRRNSEKLDDVHVLVNGNLSRERLRNEQLIAELQKHGIPVPPRPETLDKV
jgi:hypothetical protein